MEPFLVPGSVWYWGILALECLSTPESKGGCLPDKRAKGARQTRRADYLPERKHWDFQGAKDSVGELLAVACRPPSGGSRLRLPQMLESLPLSLRPAGCAPFEEPQPEDPGEDSDAAFAAALGNGSGGNDTNRPGTGTGKGTKRGRDSPGADRPEPRPKTKRQKAAAAAAAAARKQLRLTSQPHKVVDVQGQAVIVIPDDDEEAGDGDGPRRVRFQIDTAVPVRVKAATGEDPERVAGILQHIAMVNFSHDLMMVGEPPVPDAVRRRSVRAMLETFALAGRDVDSRVDRVMQFYHVRPAATCMHLFPWSPVLAMFGPIACVLYALLALYSGLWVRIAPSVVQTAIAKSGSNRATAGRTPGGPSTSAVTPDRPTFARFKLSSSRKSSARAAAGTPGCRHQNDFEEWFSENYHRSQDGPEAEVPDDEEPDVADDEGVEDGCEEDVPREGATADAGGTVDRPDEGWVTRGDVAAPGGDPPPAGEGGDDEPDVEEDAGGSEDGAGVGASDSDSATIDDPEVGGLVSGDEVAGVADPPPDRAGGGDDSGVQAAAGEAAEAAGVGATATGAANAGTPPEDAVVPLILSGSGGWRLQLRLHQ